MSDFREFYGKNFKEEFYRYVMTYWQVRKNLYSPKEPIDIVEELELLEMYIFEEDKDRLIYK